MNDQDCPYIIVVVTSISLLKNHKGTKELLHAIVADEGWEERCQCHRAIATTRRWHNRAYEG